MHARSLMWTLCRAAARIGCSHSRYRLILGALVVTALTACGGQQTDAPAAPAAVAPTPPAPGPGPSASPAPNATPSASTAVKLPVEVMGDKGAMVSANVQAPAGASAAKLWLHINNLSYDGKASVQINDGVWSDLTNASVQIEGAAKAYGGIGGGYSSMKLMLPAQNVRNGANTINFRFNGTDGISSGYRILAFNLLDTNGKNLIGAENFIADDPATWTVPRPNEVAQGEQLWRNAQLKETPLTGARNLQARCADCHAQDGRDLHQFNYSNLSIVERSRFHGLSKEQGEQIASYIRSLKTALGQPGEKCRPWNPPYQPGPGLDAKPLNEWTCGAGLEWALENDLDTLQHVFPNGVNKQAIATSGRINLRETPIAFQLPDWKRWLPKVHPKDAWGDAFINHNLNKRYGGEGGGTDKIVLRDRLKSGGVDYATGRKDDLWNDLYYWGVEWGERFDAKRSVNLNNAADQSKVYGTALWLVVKNWELAQEFGLESHCPTLYKDKVATIPAINAGKVEPRSWCGHWRFVFDASPHILGLPEQNSIFGSEKGRLYFANAWYQLQVLLNPGSGYHAVHLPTDWQYAYGLMNDLRRGAGRVEPMRNLLYIVKGTQEMDNGVGVTDVGRGWNFRDATPLDVWGGGKGSLWQGVPDDVRKAVVNSYLETWLETSERYPESQWQRLSPTQGDDWCGWSTRYLCWRDYVPGTLRGKSPTRENFATWSFDSIPSMRQDGIDGALLNRYADLMHKLYPNGNFLSLKQ
jgi:hypothetical protein